MKIGDIEIKELIRSNRKSIALEINKSGDLIVRAPLKMPHKSIISLVKEKSDWILKHKSNMLAKAPEKRLFTNGELFYYRGEKYPLRIVNDNSFAIYFTGGEFQLDGEMQQYADQIFKIWYKRQAMKILIPRAYELAEFFKFKPKIFKLSSADKRWGSCSSRGSINLNWKLIMAPPITADYVIIHELAHLKYLDHSQNFWFLVEQMMPDYQAHVKYLKDNGNKFEL